MTATLAGLSRLVIVTAVCWVASIGVAGAEPVTTIRNSGPSANRVDLVIMGDGFTASQIASGEYASQIQIQTQPQAHGRVPIRRNMLPHVGRK